MQRAQIGITGLAVVFLVVLLAAAVVGFRSDNSASSNTTADATANSSDEPKDPLAELGVAPGGAASDSHSPVKPSTP